MKSRGVSIEEKRGNHIFRDGLDLSMCVCVGGGEGRHHPRGKLLFLGFSDSSFHESFKKGDPASSPFNFSLFLDFSRMHRTRGQASIVADSPLCPSFPCVVFCLSFSSYEEESAVPQRNQENQITERASNQYINITDLFISSFSAAWPLPVKD